MSTYMLLIPKGETTLAPGSGIVAEECGDIVKVYYEGNLYGAENLVDIHDRVLCAAGRLHDRAPTVAWHTIAKHQLEDEYVIVGRYHYGCHRFEITPDMEPLWASWANTYRLWNE